MTHFKQSVILLCTSWFCDNIIMKYNCIILNTITSHTYVCIIFSDRKVVLGGADDKSWHLQYQESILAIQYSGDNSKTCFATENKVVAVDNYLFTFPHHVNIICSSTSEVFGCNIIYLRKILIRVFLRKLSCRHSIIIVSFLFTYFQSNFIWIFHYSKFDQNTLGIFFIWPLQQNSLKIPKSFGQFLIYLVIHSWIQFFYFKKSA